MPLMVMASKLAVASIRPASIAAIASGIAFTPTTSGISRLPGHGRERIQHAQRHVIVGAQYRIDALQLVGRAGKGSASDIPLVFAAQRQSDLDIRVVGERLVKPVEPLAAGRGCRRAFDDDDLPASGKLRAKMARNAQRQGMIVRADEAHALPDRRAGNEVEQWNARGVEAENCIVHRGFMHGHEHDCVGPRRDRPFDQRDLLAHIVRLRGHIVQRRSAQPYCGAVGPDPSRLIRRIGAVLGEDGDPR